MVEKVGTIKNPLTIIAIFAGLAEVGGTIVLPFISENNQLVFIYFLMIFPCLLVILFFVTLNWNNKVLYAPSDYKDEENYIRIFKYDNSIQKNVEVTIPNDNQFEIVINQLNEMNEQLETKIYKIEKQIENSKTNPEDISIVKDLYQYKISNSLIGHRKFVTKMSHLGYKIEIYRTIERERENPSEHKSIWLGKNIPLEIAIEVIKESKKSFPNLSYIHISNTIDDDSPRYIDDQIFIGGSTETAIDRYGLSAIKSSDFEKINSAKSIEELHKLIYKYYPLNNDVVVE